eukprot:g137.t1
MRNGSIGEQVGGNWRLLQSTPVESGGQKNVPIGQVFVRGSYTLHVACSSSIIYSSTAWLSKDRDYSGCPCRSWNGIVEYRCEVESVYRDQHLRRWASVMHQDTTFAMRKAKIQRDVVSYTATASAMKSSTGAWPQALSLCGAMQESTIEANVISYTVLIDSQKGRPWPVCVELLGGMRAATLRANAVTFGAVVSCYERVGQWPRAMKILQMMPKAHVQVDLVTYNAAISSCEKGFYWQGALILMEDMCKTKIAPDVVSFSAAISSLEKGNEWQRALSLFETMLLEEVQPNAFTFGAVISSCAKSGRWQHALSIFETMVKDGVQMDVVSCNAAISSCEKGAHWQGALDLIDEMPKARIPLDVISFSAAISACEKANQCPWALSLFEAMPMVKIQANLISFNAAMSSCEKAGRWELALNLLSAMPDAGIEPDIVSFNAVISSCEKDGQWQHALSLFESALEAKLQLTSISFPAHRVALASASPVFAKMLQSSMKEAQTRSIVIEDVSPEVVAKALRFMYTGEVADDVDIESLGFAHKYDITGMMQPVSSKILKNLSPENVSATVRSLRPYKRSQAEADAWLLAPGATRLLLDQAPNLVTQVDNSGRSGLHLACALGSAPAVELLMANGADAGLQDDFGFMPLHYAIDSRNLESVKLMAQPILPMHRPLDVGSRAAVAQAWLAYVRGGDPLALRLRGRAGSGEGAPGSGLTEVGWKHHDTDGGDLARDLQRYQHRAGHPPDVRPTWTSARGEWFMHPGGHREVVDQLNGLCPNRSTLPGEPSEPQVLCGENGLLRAELFRELRWIGEPNMAPLVDVLRVHEFWYVQRLAQRVQQVASLRADRPMAIDSGDTKAGADECEACASRASWAAALHAAGAVLEAVDQVCNEQARNAFCAIRPPGHHLGPAGAVDKKDPRER